MKTIVRLTFDSSDIPGGADAILGPAGCGPDVATVEDAPVLRQVPVWVTLERTDRRLQVLRALLRAHNEVTLEFHEDRYTEEEFDRAPLLLMQPTRKCEIDGGVKWGVMYDVGAACQTCGSGARQTSALFVDGEQQGELSGHHSGATYHWHFLVDEMLASKLEEIGATGLSLRSVYAVMPDKRQVKLRWRQLGAQKTIPRMSTRSTGFTRDKPCAVCDRTGWFGMNTEPTRPVYRAADIQGADDFNFTWEQCGSGILRPNPQECVFNHGWMLVTPRIRRAFLDAGATELDWFPVRVEEEA